MPEIDQLMTTSLVLNRLFDHIDKQEKIGQQNNTHYGIICLKTDQSKTTFNKQISSESRREGRYGRVQVAKSLQFCYGGGGEGDVTQVEGSRQSKKGWRAPVPSASWAKITIMTECMKENVHLQSVIQLITPSTYMDRTRVEKGGSYLPYPLEHTPQLWT